MKQMLLLFIFVVVSASLGTAQYACYNPYNKGKCPTNDKIGDCECMLQLDSDGYCSCSSNACTCAKGESCPDNCEIGTDVPLSAKNAAFVIKSVDMYPNVVTVYTHRKCAEGNLGAAIMKRATTQGKAVRFILVPDPPLTQAMVDNFNETVRKLQPLIRKENGQDKP